MTPSIGRGLALLAGSTLVALYFASQAVLNPSFGGGMPWSKALAVNLAYYYGWGLSVPLIKRLTRRFPFEGPRWRTALLAHALASVGVAVAITVAAEVILSVVLPARAGSLESQIAFGLAANLHSTLPTYWMILLATAAFDFYARMRDRELRAAQLESSLSEARLDALRMQLRPHFLFNTLNSISTLIQEDPRSANKMLSRLAGFLRSTIRADQEHLVPLREELDFVARYVEIEQVRFEGRLQVRYDVDPQAHEALVPTLILQPVVENAIHHAIAPRIEGGSIAMAARVTGSRLILTVEDDGPGITNEDPSSHRIGLRNTRARLQHLYGGDFSLELRSVAPWGVSVTVDVPFQSAPQISVHGASGLQEPAESTARAIR
jgi:two-component system LytT family sensor kinase